MYAKINKKQNKLARKLIPKIVKADNFIKLVSQNTYM